MTRDDVALAALEIIPPLLSDYSLVAATIPLLHAQLIHITCYAHAWRDLDRDAFGAE